MKLYSLLSIFETIYETRANIKTKDEYEKLHYL